MKKTYSNPAMQVVRIEQMQMLCASTTDIMKMDDTSVDVFDNPADDIDKIEDIW